MDIRINLLFVGSTLAWQCSCHSRIDSQRGKHDCQAALELREHLNYSEIEDACRFILRLPKDSSPERIEEAMNELEPSVAALVRRELLEAKVLK